MYCPPTQGQLLIYTVASGVGVSLLWWTETHSGPSFLASAVLTSAAHIFPGLCLGSWEIKLEEYTQLEGFVTIGSAETQLLAQAESLGPPLSSPFTTYSFQSFLTWSISQALWTKERSEPLEHTVLIAVLLPGRVWATTQWPLHVAYKESHRPALGSLSGGAGGGGAGSSLRQFGDT